MLHCNLQHVMNGRDAPNEKWTRNVCCCHFRCVCFITLVGSYMWLLFTHYWFFKYVCSDLFSIQGNYTCTLLVTWIIRWITEYNTYLELRACVSHSKMAYCVMKQALAAARRLVLVLYLLVYFNIAVFTIVRILRFTKSSYILNIACDFVFTVY